MFLEAHFGDVELHMPEVNPDEPAENGSEASFWVRLDDAHAQINLISMVNPIYYCNVRQLMDFFWQNVTSSDAALKKRVEAVLDMAVTTVGSLAESFAAMAPVEDDNMDLLVNKDKS